jgi:predicted DNA-binding transcriptional regulator YafY
MPRKKDDIKKIILLLNYLEERGGRVSVEEVCEHFGMSEKELQQVANKIIFCGKPPYTYDTQFTFEVEDGYIEFKSPLYKTPRPGFNDKEAFAFLFALMFLEELYRDAESSIEMKVIEEIKKTIPSLLYEAARKQLEVFPVVTRMDAPEGFPNAVGEARRRSVLIRINYYSLAHQEIKEYRVAPIGIRFAFQNYYLLAFDVSDFEVKTFLFKNILSYELLDEEFVVSEEIKSQAYEEWRERFLAGKDARTVTLIYRGKSARFISEMFERENFRWLSDDEVEVTVRFISHEWLLSRFILPFSGEVRIKEPREVADKIKKLLKKAEELLEV